MQCKFVKENNYQCEAEALKGKDLCFFHSKDKKVVERRLSANASGGLNRVSNNLGRNAPEIGYFSFKTVHEVLGLLEFTINKYLQGKIAREKASCIGYLANITIGAIKDNSFEQRLEVIEDVLKQSKQA